MFLTHIYYLLISSAFTRMLTYSKLKYIINYCSFIAGASIPPRALALFPQSHRPSPFYGARFESMGGKTTVSSGDVDIASAEGAKLRLPKARSCDCRRQEAPRDYGVWGIV